MIGLTVYIFNDIRVEQSENNYQVKQSKPLKSDKGYGVSSSHPLAVKVGMEILENGGNAVDAAVAVSYALGVVEPYSSGIGGGGEMIIMPGDNQTPIFYEYRETAPFSGKIPQGYVGIPGLVKGMELINAELGSMNIKELIQPAVDLAEKGFEADNDLSKRLENASYRMPVSSLPHFYPDGVAIKPKAVIKQHDLANTLKLIQEHGSDAFYDEEIAEQIVDKVKGLKATDLKNYSVVKADPVYGKFKDFEIISAPPPLSGVTLIQSLRMAEILNLQSTKENTADFIHLVGEISKRAYHDRLSEIADPAFYQSPKDLTSRKYSKKLAEEISIKKLSDDYKVNDSIADEEDYDNTTHFVIMDKEGTMVSATHTLGHLFGSGKYAAGFFLNNQLSNFSQAANRINSIEPGKRPRSFTSPSILRNDEMMIGIGTPGGKRIPQVLTQVLARHLLFGDSIQDAIDAPRFYVEDKKIYVEDGFPSKVLDELRDRGYRVIIRDSPYYYGGVQALIEDKEEKIILGGADQRRTGIWQVRE
ncbi:gamma-glutamyltransferase [Cytobacillus depressus]|uniref:Glutathione hydrolase proenzyme n=2 Tax=Cytobacillus depressus TaxID=1602942 RepID=A0A6L3V411_9BACI|nr:gamma-glutamyltransferase [Cytobacillus depressus]